MAIVKGVVNTPKKVVIYGPEGIGKSTFASKFPNPVFVDTEGSTKYLDVDRFAATESWQDVLDHLDEAVKEGYKTLVVDTADWAEMLCIKAVCKEHGVNGIEDIGYGKGYVYVQEKFKQLLDKLDQLIAKGVHIVVTAHAQMRKFEQPDEMGAYDRWEMKLSKKVAPMLKEWADLLLFANYQTIVVEDTKTKSKKAAGGARVMYTSHHACWDAKNRFGLPEKLDFSYDAIRKIIEGAPVVKDNLQKSKDVPAEEPKKEPEPQINNVKEGQPEELPFDQPGDAYKELKELMQKAGISDDEVVAACVHKNFQPAQLLVKDYPEDFIREVLIAKFDSFARYIKRNIKDIPFIDHGDNNTQEENKK